MIRIANAWHVVLSNAFDRIAVNFHGYGHTHIDSLAHEFVNGAAYNGYAPDEATVINAGGHARNLGGESPHDIAPAALPSAVHSFAMNSLGVHMFDVCDLEALSQAAAARKRWEFLVTAAPLPIRGGTGSPINPIATF